LGSFKIIYSQNPNLTGLRRKTVIVTPKDKKAFLAELQNNVDPRVILINNDESAFKKKKNEQ
jgi:hypothetical protein